MLVAREYDQNLILIFFYMINELNDCRSHFLSQEFKVKSNFFYQKKENVHTTKK